ncbi:MAG TPA: hypothetical protein VK661_11705 [Planctomycetota bacterium]|nr:hypothetical protein [Planctomycetota bacterium]
MNLARRGGLLLFLLLPGAAQEPARPDLAARFSRLAEEGPEPKRDLAARALRSLGPSGHEALRRLLKAHPDLADKLPSPDAPPLGVAIVRVSAAPGDEGKGRAAIAALARGNTEAQAAEKILGELGTSAETVLWEALDAREAGVSARAAGLLRKLYTPPDEASPGFPSDDLKVELDRRRDFDIADRTLAQILKEETFSWILMIPRDPPVTFRMRGVTLRDFLRLAAPKLSAVPVGNLLVLIPPDRVATAEAADVVWAPTDLAPRIEAALDALAKGIDRPIEGLAGVSVYHALRKAARSGSRALAERAARMRSRLEQRFFFVDAAAGDEGPPVDLDPAGSTAAEAVAAFEKAAGRRLEVLDRSRLDGLTPAFRFRKVPADRARRALEFRLNRIP